MSQMNEQETFWAGNFGDEYALRNTGSALVASNLCLFARILEHAQKVHSVVEFGANIGLNLDALHMLLPKASVEAIEINAKATEELARRAWVRTHNCSILEWVPAQQYDLVLCKGVLIHINPEQLSSIYDKLYASTCRYICIAEYFNPSPVAMTYRGHADKLFKRDFAGELLQRYEDLVVTDHGFASRRNPNFPQDDINWFLLEKR